METVEQFNTFPQPATQEPYHIIMPNSANKSINNLIT